jgi:adenosylcobinamide-GDP ribazoletransferase
MREAGFGLLLAIQFLTRIPVPFACPWTPTTSRWAVRCYPLVGLLLGAFLAVIASLLQGMLPDPLLALLLLSGWVALSGGLHLDGLMDVADALGSNALLEGRWSIMKDPQVGSFGTLALVFLLAWKGMLLWAMLDAGIDPVIIALVPVLGRLAGVALLVEVPAARPEGLAWSWKQHLGRRDLWLSTLPLLPLAFWVSDGFQWLGVLLCALLTFLLLYAALVIRAFKGVNGDIIGAAIEGGELWLLLIAWSWWSFVMA